MAGASGVARRARRVALLLALATLAARLGSPSAFVPTPSRVQGPSARDSAAVQRRFFNLGGEPEPAPQPPVVIKEDYTLAAFFLVVGTAMCATLPFLGLGLGAFILLLGILFYVQAGRVRFVFDGDAFAVTSVDETGDLNEVGENILIGGENRWKYTSFVNWEFFPKGLVEAGLPPVLVYFKETQTPKEKWQEGPGAQANSEEALAEGAVPGQVHFFPCICDAKQIKAEFEKRGCAKIASSE